MTQSILGPQAPVWVVADGRIAGRRAYLRRQRGERERRLHGSRVEASNSRGDRHVHELAIHQATLEEQGVVPASVPWDRRVAL